MNNKCNNYVIKMVTNLKHKYFKIAFTFLFNLWELTCSIPGLISRPDVLIQL